MSTYQERLRNDKKLELSRKVSAAIVDDIWCMAYVAADEQEFVDFLMTVTDQEAVEEFFNQCHDAGGRFCGGSGGAASGKFKAPGPHLITRKPGVGVYMHQRDSKKLRAEVKKHRAASEDFKRVVGPMGHVRSKKLAATNLKKFTTDQLKTIDTQAGVIQHNTDFMRRYSLSPVQRIIMGGISRRAGAQRTRVRNEIKKRGSKPELDYSLDGVVEFADESSEDREGLASLIEMLSDLLDDTGPDAEFDDKEKPEVEALIEHLKSL